MAEILYICSWSDDAEESNEEGEPILVEYIMKFYFIAANDIDARDQAFILAPEKVHAFMCINRADGQILSNEKLNNIMRALGEIRSAVTTLQALNAIREQITIPRL